MPRIPRLRIFPAEAPLGSRLLGMPNESLQVRRIRVQILLTTFLVVANTVGALVVGVLITVVIPGPNVLEERFLPASAIVIPVYVAFAMLVGVVWGTKIGIHGLRWALEDRIPTRQEQVAALAMPWRLTAVQAVLWSGGTAAITITFGIIDPNTIPKVAFTIGFAGVTVCAFGYLLSEFALRSVAARALAQGDPRRIRIAGITRRALLAWVLGTGVPVAGLMIVAIFSFVRPVTTTQLCVTILGLGGITLVFGSSLATLGSRLTLDPIRSVIRAMGKIERGEGDELVVVYDGTELGELQSGFNRMAEGLRERERIRDMFGRHVGHEVAEAALRRNPELGGEERTVAVFFIDIIGSTRLAATTPPREVVNLLNKFFDVVVDEVDKHGGIINKFEGDAALAIFGAPVDAEDPAGDALATARVVGRRLRLDVPDCDAAIGVAYGIAVAGNIGARERFEYTVIGDPVNEASRLCELAKSAPGLVLASERAVAAANPAEAQHWDLNDAVTLRGRSQPTRLATPID